MELVKQITCISHDGFQSMWYPFHFEKNEPINIINCESFREGIDFIKLVQWMFATNNHNNNARIDNSKSLGTSQLVQCSVEFVTDKHRYLLSRIFHDKFSIEAKLELRIIGPTLFRVLFFTTISPIEVNFEPSIVELSNNRLP